MRLAVTVLFIAISITGQAIVLSESPQETKENLLIKKGRELANQTRMEKVVEVDTPSGSDLIEMETVSPGTLLFIEEKVKMETEKGEYGALIVIVGKEKQTEELQLRHYYKYTVQFEKRNDEWKVVGTRYTHPKNLI